MRRVQRVAVELFTERGFGEVTVEEVARAADVSPVSVYRWFGTKEGLVLWDDYDPALFERIAAALPGRRPLEAVRDAVVDELDRIYAADAGLVLARTRLIHREPQVMAASRQGSAAMASALSELFATGPVDRYPASVLGSTAVAVLTAAIGEWERADGGVPLAELVRSGFDALEESVCPSR